MPKASAEAYYWDHRSPQDAAPVIKWIEDHGAFANFKPLSGGISIQQKFKQPLVVPSGSLIIFDPERGFSYETRDKLAEVTPLKTDAEEFEGEVRRAAIAELKLENLLYELGTVHQVDQGSIEDIRNLIAERVVRARTIESRLVELTPRTGGQMARPLASVRAPRHVILSTETDLRGVVSCRIVDNTDGHITVMNRVEDGS